MIVKFIDSEGYHITAEGVWHILTESDNRVSLRPVLTDRFILIRSEEDPDNKILCHKASVNLTKIQGGLTII